MAVDINKLIRIMRMTESNADGEALNALRMANAMLKADGKTWEDVITLFPRPLDAFAAKIKTGGMGRGTRRYGAPTSQRKRDDGLRHTDPSIPAMLSALTTRKHDVATLMMLAGIKDHWDRNRWLTTDQLTAVRSLHAGSGGGASGPGRKGGGTWRF